MGSSAKWLGNFFYGPRFPADNYTTNNIIFDGDEGAGHINREKKKTRSYTVNEFDYYRRYLHKYI